MCKAALRAGSRLPTDLRVASERSSGVPRGSGADVLKGAEKQSDRGGLEGGEVKEMGGQEENVSAERGRRGRDRGGRDTGRGTL